MADRCRVRGRPVRHPVRQEHSVAISLACVLGPAGLLYAAPRAAGLLGAVGVGAAFIVPLSPTLGISVLAIVWLLSIEWAAAAASSLPVLWYLRPPRPTPGGGKRELRRAPKFLVVVAVGLALVGGPGLEATAHDGKLGLGASRKVVRKGARVTLTARLSPCEGHEREVIRFYRGPKKIRKAPSDGSCVATIRVRVRRTSAFRAKMVEEGEVLVSNKVRVRVR